jgi:hypothetical protein
VLGSASESALSLHLYPPALEWLGAGVLALALRRAPLLSVREVLAAMIADRECRPTQWIELGECPGVWFVELQPRDEDAHVSFIVEGATVQVRRNAVKRFRAAMVEFGCRMSDLVFHDISEIGGT